MFLPEIRVFSFVLQRAEFFFALGDVKDAPVGLRRVPSGPVTAYANLPFEPFLLFSLSAPCDVAHRTGIAQVVS
jgi:hypothetical protein